MSFSSSELAIDRLSPVPMYFQIERAIAHEIVSGRLQVGAQVPPESELASRFNVSRSVVRQALARLEQQGLLSRRRGRGSFVTHTEPRSWQLQSSRGFFEDEVRQQRSVVSKVTRAEVVEIPQWAADALNLPPKARGVVLERLRYVDGLLTIYDLNYLLEEFAEAVASLKDDPHGSLYEVLRKVHALNVAVGRRTVDAVIAGERFANILEVDVGAPLLFVEAVDLDEGLRPFDCYRTWFRPDRLKIQVEVVQSGASQSVS